MSKRSLLLLLFLLIPIFSEDTPLEDLYSELEYLRERYHDRQSTFEHLTRTRWNQKEEHTRLRKRNRDHLEELQTESEELLRSLTSKRENQKVIRSEISSQEEEIQRLQHTWKEIVRAVEEKDRQYSDYISQDFPLHKDSLFVAHRALQDELSPQQNPGTYYTTLLDLKVSRFMESRFSQWFRTRVVLPEEEIQDMRVLRIGHAVAYGIVDTSQYYLNFLGEDRANPFEWQRVADQSHGQMIDQIFSSHVSPEEGQLLSLPLDPVQTTQTRDMLGREEMTTWEYLQDFIEKGGFMMAPLGVMMLWALVLVVNRLIVYHVRHKRSYTFINKAVQFLEKGDIEGAKTLAEKNSGVLARILQNSIEHSERNRASAEKAVKEILLTEIPILEKHLDTLAVIAASAPLMGLLGTVTGMIRMFTDITRFGTGDPQLLAGGISEALVTTETGLIIAIPVLLLHNFLRNRRNRIQSDIEMYAMRILNRLWPAE
ncbi:MotA/TolQ/ExbB proton channel family protein [Chitinivibrio alkaliphilus]|uniref:MotA/TolQ/ExbB proton channel n=1 Tax=Chitinivibrio alkaliphilus ACht1 TaxID=1313304 RepID=U7D8N4_9BACT|nr:MotA/TolQ/ExbB proton channel family protein [Chitinivibrio alkaliphilus]ERP31452.1 MotA/TolQ/ExbB proton channel [Chitinivibrio alkaliphilus ACht1]